jgi:hypothetical protein
MPWAPPARRLRGVQPQDAERHRQAAPAFQHADQIGVVEVVIGRRIAGQAEIPVQHAGEQGTAAFEVAAIRRGIRRRGLHRGAGDGGQPLRPRPPIGLRRVHAGELQRHGGDVEFGVGQATGGFERGPGLILAGQGHGGSVAAGTPRQQAEPHPRAG